MQITMLDWGIILLYFVFLVAIGLMFRKRAGQSLAEYFVSGRSLPWWLAGTSMVATTFAADTPLAVTGLVAKYGVAGNWLWWNMVLSGLLTVFLFARLWRRAEVLTDVEFTEIRYSGKPAAILRGFRALYLALPINCIVMGWVTLAMAKIMGTTLGIDKWLAVGICVAITFGYSFLSGLWGVVITDFFQFFLAVAGAILLAVFALGAVGGISGLEARLAVHYGNSSQILTFTPEIGSAWMPVTTFLVYLAVNWWAAWYPGAEPGGGGYIAQRMFSTKNEKHALGATLWFNIAHYCLRPWPWILVALASMVLYPELADKEAGYVKVMVDYLPVGFRGLMIATFAAAFMSTISTQLNWGSSYLVNDFYARFIRKNADAKHYVLVSRASTAIILGFGAIATMYLDTVAGAWRFLLALGAGTGLVYILRWYWWRINAWSEISAMAASLVTALVLQFGYGLNNDDPNDFALIMLITVGVSTVIWLFTTFATAPEPAAVLQTFYQKVHPGGAGWRTIAASVGMDSNQNSIPADLLAFGLGSVMIFTLLFGIGKLIFAAYSVGALYIASAVFCGWAISRLLSKTGWQSMR